MRFLIALFILALAILPARAQQADPSDTGTGAFSGTPQQPAPPLPAPLAAQQKGGSQAYYLGKYDQLDGWLMVRQGQPEFYYATPGAKALVLGVLFDQQGNLLTGNQVGQLEMSKETGLDALMGVQKQSKIGAGAPAPTTTAPATTAPAPDNAANMAAGATPPAPRVAAPAPQADVQNLTPAQQLFMDVRAGNLIVAGRRDVPAVFAFIDPNCQHCQRFLREITPWVEKDLIAVGILPVGFDDKSRKQAAFMITAPDGAARMVAYAKGDEAALPVNDDMNTDAVRNNLKIMDNWNLSGTPIIVYLNAQDEVKLVRGRPLDIPAMIADIRGGQ